jgi:hypothetical protein
MWILRSYRWRRRLLRLAVLAAAIGLIVLGVHLSTPGHEQNANGPNVKGYTAPTTVPFTRSKQRAANRVLAAFARTAVARKDVYKSWDLAAPSLRSGISRKDWDSGQLPVPPYPAINGKWTLLEYSYRKTLGLLVVLFPRPGSGYQRMTADTELVQDRQGRWLVDYWMPQQYQGPPSTAKSAKSHAKPKLRAAGHRRAHRVASAKKQAAANATTYQRSRPSRAWWAIPIVILSLIVVVPISLGLVGWYRNRRVQRAYARSKT